MDAGARDAAVRRQVAARQEVLAREENLAYFAHLLPMCGQEHSQYREPLQWGLPLCPLGDRSGSQELAVLKTVAIAGSWQLEDSF